MRHAHEVSPAHQRTRQRGAAVAVGAIVAVMVIAALGVGLIYGFGGLRASGMASAGTSTPYRPSPPPRLPRQPSSIPPIQSHVLLQTRASSATPTPCPTFTLPPSVVGQTPTTGTSGAGTTSVAPPEATIPPCGDGQIYGPRCYTVLPGPVPTQDEVRQALLTAAQQNSMPFSLVESIGWQESGWQENVQACDGGVGVMQLQPETTQWLNQQYNTNYSPYDLTGNVTMGVTLLNWLYNYYIPFCNQGLPAGQTCDWNTVWPGATDGATIRQIVESAYNEGVGTMASYGIQNWNYVNSVESLLAQFTAADPTGT